MATATTDEILKTGSHPELNLFSTIQSRSLFIRLFEETERAASEFVRDPVGFIASITAGEAGDERRRKRIYAGLATAIVVHIVLVVVIAILGWKGVYQKSPDEPQQLVVTHWVPLPGENQPPPPSAGNQPGPSGTNAGGGDRSPRPAHQGVLPPTVPRAPIVQLSDQPVHNPVLPVAGTIEGPQTTDAPPPPTSIGDPNGKPGPWSAGPGDGGGIGSGKGASVGGGDRNGPPGNPNGGRKNGTGNGPPDSTTGITEVDFNQGPRMQGFVQFSWIYRPRPVVTPEAQAMKAAGTVILRATFTADGRVTDIEVQNPVAFMTESAIASLEKSRFRPASLNGRPITLRRVIIRINVHTDS